MLYVGSYKFVEKQCKEIKKMQKIGIRRLKES